MPIEVIASPNTIVSNLRHSENKDRAIEVTLLEIVADISPSQKQNADSPIEITLLGIVTDINPLQKENVMFPIVVTLLGMVTDVNSLQLYRNWIQQTSANYNLRAF